MEQGTTSADQEAIQARPYTTWLLIKLYWQSSQRKSAYLFSIAILAMTIAIVGVDVLFNQWYSYFYNALQAYNAHETVHLLVIFCVLATVAIVLSVYRYYIAQLFGLRWRRWLTEQFINRWLRNRGYYYLENFDASTDNPDQRIQEDVNAIVSNSIDLTTGFVSAITTFPAFVYILWSLSGVLTISLGSFGTLKLPGYLVWVSIIYAIVGTWLAFKIGRPLVGLNFEQQRREATFRYSMIDLRNHAESVALYHGEANQKNILKKWFYRVLDNWYLLIQRTKKLLWYTAGYNQLSVLLPLVVALPNYFNKVFMLGGLIQSLQAFNKVQDSLSFLVNSFTQIAQWRAISQRLITFANHLTVMEANAARENKIITSKHSDNSIDVKNLSIKTPRGDWLLNNISQQFEHGQHYLIKGPSGIGKSTFVRTIGGVWPYAVGNITYPEKTKFLYLPQNSYMPIGTLADALLFPDHLNPKENHSLEQVLRDCRLEELIPRLHEEASWSEQLSPGELQRVAFARVLLQKPDWVFMDESTSSLDLDNERHLYQLILDKLPHCSIVSVGHRPSLESFHTHVIDMADYAGNDQK